MFRRFLGLGCALFLFSPSGCDTSKIPGLWQEYQHPTYRFTARIPRTWDIKTDGLRGADVVFMAPKDDPLFRASVNVTVQRRKSPEMTLDRLIDLSAKQLSFIFQDYQVLSRAPNQIGNLSGQELRARYQGPEGPRIIRTIVSLTRDSQYVVTFSCRENREGDLLRTFERIRRSFHFSTNLSDG